MQQNRWVRAAVVFLSSALGAWIAFHLLGGQKHFVLVWPVTAVGLAFVLPLQDRGRDRLWLVAAFGAGTLAGAAVAGEILWLACWLAAAQAIEVWVAASLLRTCVTSFADLKELKNIGRFWGIALLCAAGRAELVTSPLVVARDLLHWVTWLRVTAADSLGTVVLLPCLLFLTSGRQGRQYPGPHRARRAVLLVLLLAAVTVGVFYQRELPLLFLVSSPLLALVFVAGTEGAALGTLVTVVLGGWLTELGRGPISLVRIESHDMRMLMFQFFAATVVTLAMPVGALLDERRRAEVSVREGQRIYTTLLEHAEGMMVLSSFDGARRFVSAVVASVTGWTPEQFLAQGALGPVHASEQQQVGEFLRGLRAGQQHRGVRYRMLLRSGSYLWVEATAQAYAALPQGEVEGFVATIRDVSAQVQMEEAWSAERAAMTRERDRLVSLAVKDELTGLLNRRGFNSQLRFEMQRRDRTRSALSLLMLDVDLFKQFNDRLGHPAGDACLRAIAEVLRTSIRRVTDTAARVGGEEFAVILAATETSGALQVGLAIQHAVETLGIVHPDSPYAHVTISIGVGTIPAGSLAEPVELLEAADRALYASKRGGRNRVTGSPAVGRTESQLRGESA